MASKCMKTTVGPERLDTSRKEGGRFTQAVWQAIVGFLFGYFVLHPISMIIFRLFDVPSEQGVTALQGSRLWEPFVNSFHFHMLPMGLAFGVLSALFALVGGHQHTTIRRQRDRLKSQLTLNEGYRNELQEQTRQLVSNNEELERAERARERAMQFMVHDLKNHLACIGGFADFLLRKARSNRMERFTEGLELICRQARQMDMDVKNFLDVGYLQERDGSMETEAVRSCELMTLAAQAFRLPAYENRVLVRKNGGRNPTVLGNPQLLRRVLENLISNALKHNPPATRVVLNAEENGDGFAVFSCVDNGKGIPADSAPKIFNTFQARSSEADHSTGLGLTFCQAAVAAHGGRIWYESSSGEGTCFYFTIPNTNKEERKMNGAVNQKQRVLVVDDEPDFAALMVSILDEEGYDATASYDADEALERLRDWSPDLVTLDIRMPRKSGLLLYRQLKSCPEFCDIPVILVSGVPGEDPRARIMIQPFLEADHVPLPNAFLEKPIEREEFVRVVHRALGNA